MPNRRYESGVRLERQILHAFEAAGWRGFRAAGSRGEYDLCLYRMGTPWQTAIAVRSGLLPYHDWIVYYEGESWEAARDIGRGTQKLAGLSVRGTNWQVLLIQAKQRRKAT